MYISRDKGTRKKVDDSIMGAILRDFPHIYRDEGNPENNEDDVTSQPDNTKNKKKKGKVINLTIRPIEQQLKNKDNITRTTEEGNIAMHILISQPGKTKNKKNSKNSSLHIVCFNINVYAASAFNPHLSQHYELRMNNV